MKRILIIEDDPAIVKGLQESLEDEHYNVITATDGKEGYEMAGRENPDLILLDLMLPTMNGQDICRKLREDVSYMPGLKQIYGAAKLSEKRYQHLHLPISKLILKNKNLLKKVSRFNFQQKNMRFYISSSSMMMKS
jgi:CheY-like chemotaxis protein